MKNCNLNCNRTIVATAVTLSATALTVTIPVTTFNNGDTFLLVIPQTVPSAATPVPVQIQDGTTAYNLLKPCGNSVMSDQVRTQRVYPVRVGTNPNHFTVRNPNLLCRTSFVPAQLIPGTAAEAAASADQEA